MPEIASAVKKLIKAQGRRIATSSRALDKIPDPLHSRQNEAGVQAGLAQSETKRLSWERSSGTIDRLSVTQIS
jgi:hypothetical protein